MNVIKWMESKTVQEKIDLMREMLEIDAITPDDDGFLQVLASIKADVNQLLLNNMALIGLEPVQIRHFSQQAVVMGAARSIANVLKSPALEYDYSSVWMYSADTLHFIQAQTFTGKGDTIRAGSQKGMGWEEWAIAYANENEFNALLLDANGAILGTTDDLQKPINPDDKIIDWIEWNPGKFRSKLAQQLKWSFEDFKVHVRAVVEQHSGLTEHITEQVDWDNITRKFWQEWGHEDGE